MANLIYNNIKIFTFCLETLSEWISRVARNTGTVGRVADNSTFSISSADSGARIFALVVDTSQVIGTFTIADAFWFTVRGSSDKRWQATAGWRFSIDFTLRVRTAG